VVVATGWMGRYLPPRASPSDYSTGGLPDIRRRVEPFGPYGADHRYARAVTCFEVLCASAVILVTTVAVGKRLTAITQDSYEAFVAGTVLTVLGPFGALFWSFARLPITRTTAPNRTPGARPQTRVSPEPIEDEPL